MKTDFEGRSPQPEDEITIGMVNLKNNDDWIEPGTSKAWGWQQGCMLQFVPGSDSLIIWNDRIDNKFVSHLFNIYTKEEIILPFAIYALSPDGLHAVTTDFERIQDTRPGYGYAGIPDPNRGKLAPDNAGIYLCNLQTGKKELIITYRQMVEMPMLADDAANKDRSTQLYNTNTKEKIPLGDYYLPLQYKGEWRCDTHPRSSNNGKLVCIDCPIESGGRQLILMDISAIYGKYMRNIIKIKVLCIAWY